MKVSKHTRPRVDPNTKLKNQLKQAAKMYEQQFLRHMVKSMRSTVQHSKMTKPSMAEEIYREQLDQKYVDEWSDKGGTGFADMIYKDLVDKYFPQLQSQKKMGKIRPVNMSDQFQGYSKVPSPSPDTESYLLKFKPGKNPSPLQLPWAGTFEKEVSLPDGRTLALFSHPFGLESTFVFKGNVRPGLLLKNLEVGEKFADLDAQIDSVVLRMQPRSDRKAPPSATEAEF